MTKSPCLRIVLAWATTLPSRRLPLDQEPQPGRMPYFGLQVMHAAPASGELRLHPCICCVRLLPGHPLLHTALRCLLPFMPTSLVISVCVLPRQAIKSADGLG